MRGDHILLVDDEEINLDILIEYLNEEGSQYHITTARSAEEAWEKLQATARTPQEFDLVLLDRMMDGMDGVELVRQMMADPLLRHIPVVIQTAKVSRLDLIDGLEAGAYYYLTKPFEERILWSVVRRALRDRQIYKQLQGDIISLESMMLQLQTGLFHFKTLKTARHLAVLVANAYPQPDTVLTGLQELMINAIEHGNLGITYQEKSQLHQTGEWEDEVNSRQQLPLYCDKYATLQFERSGSTITVTITDMGSGFEWEGYLSFDPRRILDNHGRGIAIANNLCFHQLEYCNGGRTVITRFKMDQ